MLRGQFYTRISEGVGDPVTVTALAVESTGSGEGRSQAIMVSCDFVGISAAIQQQVRESLRDHLPDFDPKMLFMHATHTHTAPTMEENIYPAQDAPVMPPTEYASLFVERAAEAAQEAWKARASGGASWAYGQAVVGHNRRAVYLDGSARMYGKTNDQQFACIEGYEDHGLNVLLTWDAKQKLTGMVVNIACPSQVSEHDVMVSADFWHETRQELRSRHGRDLFVLPQCAPAGDQSPHFLLFEDLEAAMRRRRGISERQEIARRIANAVDDLLDGARADIRTELVFRHHVETLNLPARTVTREEYEQAKAEVARLEADSEMEASRKYVHLRRNRQVLQRYEAQHGGAASWEGDPGMSAGALPSQASSGQRPSCPVELHVLRLGEVAMATNPFELFLDFGLRVKARSRALQTFLVQLACGQDGYLPTEKAVRGRSYGAEVASNLVGPEGGQVLVDRTVELINGLWA